MHSHEMAEQLALRFSPEDLNEANTRHQLIDPLLHDVLGWPRDRVLCEEFIKPGFADYVLIRADRSAALFIEAKREGQYFDVPKTLFDRSLCAYIKLKTLLTDPPTEQAVTQVRDYCLNTGCEFAAVTNGHQWIFFKTFQSSVDWRETKALVIVHISYFSESFTEAHNAFSYSAIIDRASLRRLFLDQRFANRELFYPKDKIHVYDAPVDANGYASSLRPIADRYFGPIDASDFDFMEECYVSDRDYDRAFLNARRRLEDAITPYLKQYSVQDFKDSKRGGSFGKRIAKNIVGARPADVVVLFGGKGVGKSTFLRRLLFHRTPHIIEKNGVVAMIDLLNVPPDSQKIQNAIWTTIADTLDIDRVLAGTRDGLCALFIDRFDQAKNQTLFGLDEQSEAYNVRLNELVDSWKKDYPYVTQRLATRVRAKHKAVIVNIDNTDQFDGELQELCFSMAQAIAATFPCIVIISMREEKFYSSSIRGVLDAYQNSGFHISSPEPREVFVRRLNYVKRLLEAWKPGDAIFSESIDREVVGSFFQIMRQNFQDKSSHISSFLTACSHGNIRLALELFRGFVVSGYTNVKEMTGAGHRWTLQIHQVIKPFMIPSRFFYSESLSRIPNVFQIRSKAHGSHFTALRILSALSAGHDRHNPPFIAAATLAMPFLEAFFMKEDFQSNMDVLLQHRLIEANNRLDAFNDQVDSVKITSYGLFMLNALSHNFTYLELTAEDCAIGDLAASNEIGELSNREYHCYSSHLAMERVEVRLKRAEIFLAYLEKEEEREVQMFRAATDQTFTKSIRDAFDREKISVRKSARRNVPYKRPQVGN